MIQKKSIFDPDVKGIYSKFNPVILKVVNRDDFVAGCISQTSTKTVALLYEHLRMVLLIEKAHNLLVNERDSFGIEALNSIKTFVEDHPGQITIIFMGCSLDNPKERKSLDHLKKYLLP